MRRFTTPAPFLRLIGWLSLIGAATCAIDYKSRMNSALQDVFGNDDSARILLVRHFNRGEFLLPTRDPELLPSPKVPRAEHGVTVVKFFIRTNGPAPELPSPNSGTDVGFEIWFPDEATWNGRIYNHIVGGLQGDTQVTELDFSSSESWTGRFLSEMATELGYVSGITNGGQSNPRAYQDMQWLLNDDGSWNLEGWKNANWQATHLLSVKSKEIAKAYYGKPAHHAYIYGCSTGGRAVYKAIQDFPEDYDGYLSSCPSITQSRLFPSLGHAFIVMNNHLNDLSAFTEVQQEVVSQRALEFGDTQVTGDHDGYFSTLANNYDPTKDLSLLSVEEGGQCTETWAFTKRQLEAINMIWYGPTLDGSIPDPSVSTGTDQNLQSGQLWWGKLRGTALGFIMGKREIVGNYFAVMLKDPSLASTNWNHPLGKSSDAWMYWSYEKYTQAILEAERLDKEVFHMDSDNPDLRPAMNAGVKMITYHALADPGVAPQSAINYYLKAADIVGGADELDKFSRLFLVPGQDHCLRSSGVAGSGNPPIPKVEEWLDLLVDWVENDKAPGQIIANSVDNTASRPICKFPKMAKYDGAGDVNKASSYTCEAHFDSGPMSDELGSILSTQYSEVPPVGNSEDL